MSPVIVITGASRGIGAAAAAWAGTLGASLVLAGRNPVGLAGAAEELLRTGSPVVQFQGDLTQAGCADRLAAVALDAFGRIDSLINNAAVTGDIAPLGQTGIDMWRAVYEVNVFAPVACTKAMLPALREARGRVVNVSSVVATVAAECLAAYSSSKAALSQITRTFAIEEPAITAVAYQPGPTATDMMVRIMERAPEVMSPASASGYQQLRASGLVDLQLTSRMLALLAMRAPRSWSGRTVDFTATDLGVLDDP